MRNHLPDSFSGNSQHWIFNQSRTMMAAKNPRFYYLWKQYNANGSYPILYVHIWHLFSTHCSYGCHTLFTFAFNSLQCCCWFYIVFHSSGRRLLNHPHFDKHLKWLLFAFGPSFYPPDANTMVKVARKLQRKTINQRKRHEENTNIKVTFGKINFYLLLFGVGFSITLD